MKLNRLKSIVNEALRTSTGDGEKYYQDPFYHYSPEFPIFVDLITGQITPDRDGDDVEKYYTVISEWFHEVIKKEGIPIEVIDDAVIHITPEHKQCIIKAKDRTFISTYKYEK
ncbi:MAG: hypothetical protein ACFFBP_20110 [Promethearchaeota archaeon]